MADAQRKDALYDQLARVGKAVASGRRVQLLELLAQGERTVEGLAAASGMSVKNTSAQLQVLRHSGLVTGRRDGSRVRYRVADDDVSHFVGALRELARRRVAEVDRAAAAYLGPPPAGEPVSREELRRRLAAGEVVVVDVRPVEEYAAGHIPGAVSLPVDELEARLDDLPADVEVVAYCRGPYCVFSAQAVRLLRRHGRQARQLEDGFPEWRLAALPVETSAVR